MIKAFALVSFTRGEEKYEPGDEVEVPIENDADQANFDQLVKMGVLSKGAPASSGSKRPPAKDVPKK